MGTTRETQDPRGPTDRPPARPLRGAAWLASLLLAARFPLIDVPPQLARTSPPSANRQTHALTVTPSQPIRPSKSVAGQLNRSFVVYVLEHPGDEGSEPIDWIASSPDAWILAGASDPTAGHLEPGQRATVIVRLDATLLPPLPDPSDAETTTGHVLFEDRAHVALIQREIAVDVIRPLLSVATVAIPSSVVQPNGPNHSFEIAPHPVTNREFAVFLNDAIYNTDNARGAAMYFDVRSGDVYMHTSTTGAEGDGADGHTI